MSTFWANRSAEERKQIRAEMLRIMVNRMTLALPEMSKGAIRVKASKFVDDAIAKEIRANGEAESIDAQQPSVQ